MDMYLVERFAVWEDDYFSIHENAAGTWIVKANSADEEPEEGEGYKPLAPERWRNPTLMSGH